MNKLILITLVLFSINASAETWVFKDGSKVVEHETGDVIHPAIAEIVVIQPGKPSIHFNFVRDNGENGELDDQGRLFFSNSYVASNGNRLNAVTTYPTDKTTAFVTINGVSQAFRTDWFMYDASGKLIKTFADEQIDLPASY